MRFKLYCLFIIISPRSHCHVQTLEKRPRQKGRKNQRRRLRRIRSGPPRILPLGACSSKEREEKKGARRKDSRCGQCARPILPAIRVCFDFFLEGQQLLRPARGRPSSLCVSCELWSIEVSRKQGKTSKASKQAHAASSGSQTYLPTHTLPHPLPHPLPSRTVESVS